MIEVYFDNVAVDSNFIYGIKQEAFLFTDSFKLGSTICRTYTLQIDTSAISTMPSTIEIKEDNVTTFSGSLDSYELYNSFSYKIVATDPMVKANYTILANGTVSDILSGICSTIGVMAPTGYYGSNLTLTNHNCTAREFISWLAEINGGYAYIDNGALVIEPFSNTIHASVQLSDCFDFTLGGEHYITAVSYNGTTIGSGEAVEININNPFITDEVLSHILSIVNELDFFSLETTDCTINTSVKAGQMISVGGYPTICQISYDYIGGWCGGYSLTMESSYQASTSTGTKTSNTLTKAIAEITQLFGGKSTGIIQFIDSDGDGVNDGIIAYDNTNPELATKIIKITSDGLAVSSDGGTTYSNAITGSGIVATAITSGSLKLGGTDDDVILEIYDSEGNLTGTWNSSGLTTEDSKTFLAANYSDSDKTRLQSILLGTIEPTEDDYDKYDFDLDGRLSTKDYLVVTKILNGDGDYTTTWKCYIQPANREKLIAVDLTKGFSNGTTTTSNVFNAFAGGVKVGSNLVDTVITDSEIDDNEGFIVFSNGMKQAYKHFTTGSLSMSAIGNIYRTAEVNYGDLPIEFTSRPVVVGQVADGYAWLSGFTSGSTTSWGKSRIYYPTAATSTYIIDLFAYGN